MMAKLGWAFIILQHFVVGLDAYSQTPAYLIIEKLPQTEWSNKEKGADLTD